ncbi:hypothetical protein WA026_008907 [Henosepilachna vigintioctopunctata]|uniref:40S ribosomal protein S25 n=1 Tax=Henosepilachna vigintioctopunctata TaxID=420089 RepID=A0AAW1V9J6_9CUCU
MRLLWLVKMNENSEYRLEKSKRLPKKDAKEGAKPSQKTQKKKEGSGGGKAKKNKWSKGKVRDKLNNQVFFYKATYEKTFEGLKVEGSLARRALIELQQKGLLKQVVQHRAQLIYTRTTKGDDQAPLDCEKISIYTKFV